uniref:Uncharacterized protein n=1 Tax=Panagrolaimus sp. JU765 TaxID=591449 RepID=A0AC34R507_9BILA
MENKKVAEIVIENLMELGLPPQYEPMEVYYSRNKIMPSLKVLSFVILFIDLLCTFLALKSAMLQALAFGAAGSLICFLVTIFGDKYCRDHLVHLTNIWIGIRALITGLIWICVVFALFEGEIPTLTPKLQLGPLEHRTRFALLILVTFCLMINWANILTFNFAIICMDPSTNDTTAHNWGPALSINDKNQAMAVVAIGALIANLPIVALINVYGPSSVGWPGIYYVHAIFATALFICFFICYRNFPDEHPYVSRLEREKIARGRDLGIDYGRRIPFKAILKSPEAWAVFIGGLGNFAGINLVFQFAPIYLNKVQGYQVVKTGFFAALPPLCQAIMKEISGYSNDKIHFISETLKTKIYNTVAFGSMATFLVILSFIPANSGAIGLVIMTVGATLLGFNTGGFYKSGSLIAGPYAPLVMGQVSTAMTIMMLIVPLIVNPLTPNNTREEWALAFYAIAAIMVFMDILYVLMASGEPCYWAKPEYWQNIDAAKKEDNNNDKTYGKNTIFAA